MSYPQDDRSVAQNEFDRQYTLWYWTPFILALLAIGALAFYVNSLDAKAHATQLEKNAGNLRIVNTVLCGTSSSQITTPNGVFNVSADELDILTNVQHVSINSAFEIAVDDDNSVRLVGPANTHESVKGCDPHSQ